MKPSRVLVLMRRAHDQHFSLGTRCNFCEDIITQEVTAELVANGSCNYNSITPMLVAQ